MGNIKRLCWVSGSIKSTGWITVDSEPAPGLDIQCDILVDGLPLDTQSIDYIVTHYALERLESYNLCSALAELFRVLKPGGVLRLGLVDLDRAIDAYKAGQSDYFWCHQWASLDGNFVTQITNYGYARTLFTYAFAEEVLRKAGFQTVCRVTYHQTCGAYPEISELDRRPEESFYVEAFKRTAEIAKAKPICAAPNQIHLSWIQDPSTSLTVTWNAPSSNNLGLLEFRVVGGETWHRAVATFTSSPGTGVLYRATITGLHPDTEYEYRVSSDKNARPVMSEAFRTRTAPPPGRAEFSFGFICDTGLIGRPDGNATGTRQIIDELINDHPLFVLGGGDYAYANRDGRYEEASDAIDAWFLQMQPLIARFPFMAQYGNHEIFLRERFRDWAPRFAHPEGFDQSKNYSFDVGEAHFTALFVPSPILRLDQLLWLDADLELARGRGMRWLIVYQHEPIFAHGHSHPAKPDVRKFLGPILERHQVDLHLSGHDQNYERTYPLIKSHTEPTRMSMSLNRYRAGEGVIYAKVSPGGKMSEVRNDFSRFTTEPQPFIAIRDDTAHHYALVTVRPKGLIVNVYGLGKYGMPKFRLDSFQINID